MFARSKRKAIHMGAALITAGAVALTAPFSASAYQQGFETVESTGTVYRVIDADTFVVNLDDAEAYAQLVELANGEQQRTRYLNDRFQSIRVRLANVDTPESVHPDASRNTEEGRRLSTEAKDILEGQPTRVSCFDWGYYGRLICSLEKPSGRDFGEWLIAEGHSPYITRWGRHPYLNLEYRQASERH